MGYYGSGFVFVQEPAWEKFTDLPAGFGLAGYAHRSRPLWLLDMWRCTRRVHWRFSGPIGESFPGAPDLTGR
jgi:hypothetical protein